jgi:hypothetical protein
MSNLYGDGRQRFFDKINVLFLNSYGNNNERYPMENQDSGESENFHVVSQAK